MDDALVEELLSELSKTRESFEKVLGAIRWNRINTVIQYGLILAVVIMMSLGTVFYFDQRRQECERTNNRSAVISGSLDANATAIGVALATVAGASAETFQEYLDVYNAQDKPEVLQPREC